MSGMLFEVLFISTHISPDLLFLGSAKAYIGWDKKLNSHFMESYVQKIIKIW